jgi:hypothetical protein
MFPRKFKGVPLFNPGNPRKYPIGGYIKPDPRMTEQQKKNDSVHIIAMPGELIIPYYKKGFEDGGLVKKVIKYLKNDLKVRLPGT